MDKPIIKTVDTFFQDCFYSKQNGPKDCIIVSVTPHGVYGSCFYSSTIRFFAGRNGATGKSQELGELVGCPAITQNLTCPYYINDEVKIG